jgi:hypothetical protein
MITWSRHLRWTLPRNRSHTEFMSGACTAVHKTRASKTYSIRDGDPRRGFVADSAGVPCSPRAGRMGDTRTAATAWVVAASLPFVLGCGGPSAQEWQRAQANIRELQANVEAASRQHIEDDQKYADAQRQIEELDAKLRELGTEAAANQKDLVGRLYECQTRDCLQTCPAASPTALAPARETTLQISTGPTDVTPTRTIPYPGNGGGPTLCSDGSVSGSSGGGTCSHHGGIAGGRHRKH